MKLGPREIMLAPNDSVTLSQREVEALAELEASPSGFCRTWGNKEVRSTLRDKKLVTHTRASHNRAWDSLTPRGREVLARIREIDR